MVGKFLKSSKNSLKSSFSSSKGMIDLRKRIFFVIISIFIYRIGSYIPIPGLDSSKISNLFNTDKNGILGLFNIFSGGSLSRLTIFALGIMPYISSSIVMQLFSSVSPSLEKLKKEGNIGQKKINQYTRIGTLILSTIQSLGISQWLIKKNIVISPSIEFQFITILTLVSGTMFLMWLGEQITEKGIGNGISIIIFSGIISRIPSSISIIYEKVNSNQINPFILIILLIFIIFIIGIVVFVECAQRKIVVSYAQRTFRRRIYSSQKSHLPLKINMAGVIPPIFASSIIMIPAVLAHWFGSIFSWLNTLSMMISPGKFLYIIFFTISIIFFSFFYTDLVFNPEETAENLKKSGAFITGIRPGKQTANYIRLIMSRLTLLGSLYLILVSLLPQIMIYLFNIPFYFGGTSLLIVVVVVIDSISQIQSHIMTTQYESLIKKSSFKRGFRKN